MKGRIYTLLVLAPLTLPLAAVPYNERHYVADEHESAWEGEGSRLHCELRHAIPGYGLARFVQEAGSPLSFRLEANPGPLNSGEALLSSRPPGWRHGTPVRALGVVEYTGDGAAFRLDTESSRRLLSELEEGMFPTFSYRDWVDGRDQVSVALSAVNAREPLEAFYACLGEVVPYSFEYVRHSVLHFNFDSETLDDGALQRLEELALYLNADPSVGQVMIEGHTDSRGFRSVNLTVGKARATEVRDFLVGRGVDDRIIEVKSYGETRPVASNRTSRGREANRRVVVTLSR